MQTPAGINRYLMRQRIFALGQDFYINNAVGQPVYKIDGKVRMIKESLKFRDMQGNLLYKLDERVICIRESFDILKPDGQLAAKVHNAIRLSGARRDLFWMVLVLYIAMLGQSFGEQYLNSYFGTFIGATLMALSSEIIARSPRRAPALVSQILAFWFLVPGARGLLSITSFLSEDLQSAAIGLGEMVMLILSITLGVLLGTLVISPHKFVPVTAATGQLYKGQEA